MIARPPDPSRDAQATLTVDLDALAANWRWLAAQARSAECGAAVKADAYGIGLARAVPALARAGCRTFFVAHVAEGVRARQALRAAGFDDAVRIFTLHGFLAETAPVSAFAEAALSPVLCSTAQVADWIAAHGGQAPPSALHVDTGMNRAGLDMAEALALEPATLAAAGVTLLMSHLVAAEEPDNPVNAAQLARFASLRRGPLAALPASLANSSGILLAGRPHYDLVRPGFALYGGNPAPDAANPMRSVVGLSARMLQLRRVPTGQTAGYGGRWTAPRDSLIATIGVGYADGFPRNARTVGEAGGPVARVGDTRCPFVGRVSMDLSLVDVTEADPSLVRPGASLELLGPSITVDDLGAACGTTGYEILTRLGARYTRDYRGG